MYNNTQTISSLSYFVRIHIFLNQRCCFKTVFASFLAHGFYAYFRNDVFVEIAFCPFRVVARVSVKRISAIQSALSPTRVPIRPGAPLSRSSRTRFI